MDQVGARVTMPDKASMEPSGIQPVLKARGLIKTFGRVVGLDGADFDLNPHEILGVIGDNGAGKSTLIKCLTGAIQPDEGVVQIDGRAVAFRRPQEARDAGIETVYQTLAVAPALDIGQNIYLGRERRVPGILGKVFRKLDKAGMVKDAQLKMAQLGIGTLQNMRQTVETLSGGQRQAVAVARAAAFASKVIVLDEPTAALGVQESRQVLDLILRLRDNGLPVILVSHNMSHVFGLADRIHVQRLGRRVAVVSPRTHSMADAVAIMTGAATA
jgi:fructose transport system ATP-binding protein